MASFCLRVASSTAAVASRPSPRSHVPSAGGAIAISGGRLSHRSVVRSSKMNVGAQRQQKRASIAAKASAETQSMYDILGNVEIDLSAAPDCKFVRVEAIIRPWRLQFVVDAVSQGGIKGMTVTKVLGIGAQSGERERFQGSEFGNTDLVEKAKVEIVCVREQANYVVRKLITAAHTGEAGDGKIFIHPVADAVRIRTGECGADAEKMAGGRSDLLSAGSIDESLDEK